LRYAISTSMSIGLLSLSKILACVVSNLMSLRLILERKWLETFHNVSEVELYSCLAKIEHQKDNGAMTKRDHKIALKRILEHLNNPLAPIIKTSTSQKYLPRFFLTVHDILKMVTCDHPHLRDKVMAACLYESNCRPHEFFMLKRSDIRFETTHAKIFDSDNSPIDIEVEIACLNIGADCKTGARSPPKFSIATTAQ